MKSSIDYLPPRKREELEVLRDLVLKYAQVEMLVLFGSFARSSVDEKRWVDHKYVKEGTVYEYNSDFDLLVVVRNQKMEEDFGIWDLIESEAYKAGVKTKLSFVVDNVHYVNEQLELGRYFYSDIKKEGVLLYDSKRYSLSEPRELSEEERKDFARKDFEYWFTSGEFVYEDFQGNLEKGRLNVAAFNLHQAVEKYFTALLLVFTGYRPKSHDLKVLLLEWVSDVDEKVKGVFFPGIDLEEERRRFELLRKAYVDARYERSYRISKDDLMVLGDAVLELHDLVESLCVGRI